MCRHYLFIAAAILAVSSSPVLAHKVNIFAYAEGDSVHTESYFSDGRKCKNSTIEVYDSSGKLLLKGTTDEEGIFAFPIPRRDDLKIVLKASMGHRSECLLSKAELGDGEIPSSSSSPSRSTASPAPTPPAQNSGDLARTVDQVLAKRLAPLTEAVHKLEKQHQENSFRDVLGGIGYIVGIMGMYYFFRNRNAS